MEQSQIHSKPVANTSKSVPDLFARVISDIANPLVMPLLVILPASLMLDIPSPMFGMITISAFLFFTLIPFGAVIYLLQSLKISSLDVPLRKNRSRLFGYSIISTTIGSILIFVLSYSEYRFLAITSAVLFLNPILAYFINRSYKISIHTAAVSTACILLMVLQNTLAEINTWGLGLSLFLLLVLLPLMFWSRHRLGIHSVPELAWGSISGIFFTLFIAGFMQTIW